MNKFNEIFLDLEQKILEKEYPPHTLLPSENQSVSYTHLTLPTTPYV